MLRNAGILFLNDKKSDNFTSSVVDFLIKKILFVREIKE